MLWNIIYAQYGYSLKGKFSKINLLKEKNWGKILNLTNPIICHSRRGIYFLYFCQNPSKWLKNSIFMKPWQQNLYLFELLNLKFFLHCQICAAGWEFGQWSFQFAPERWGWTWDIWKEEWRPCRRPENCHGPTSFVWTVGTHQAGSGTALSRKCILGDAGLGARDWSWKLQVTIQWRP